MKLLKTLDFTFTKEFVTEVEEGYSPDSALRTCVLARAARKIMKNMGLDPHNMMAGCTMVSNKTHQVRFRNAGVCDRLTDLSDNEGWEAMRKMCPFEMKVEVSAYTHMVG
jgi:hypothetical protein